MVAIACAVKLSSRGGVFFVQERQGRFGRPFRIFKFRTMSVSNENAPSRFTSQVDARVTRVGRVLRKIHFDELPQLLNIFMGDMSIVGPRPEMIHFARMMQHAIPVYQLRYIMRPGLSGLAQINQGYAGDNVKETLEKLSYDLYYIKNHSFWMDLMIIVRTIFFIWRDNTY
jgi:lipopolysaccharide/colanic/teichoic acid biosynthesis glycosyltransferase